MMEKFKFKYKNQEKVLKSENQLWTHRKTLVKHGTNIKARRNAQILISLDIIMITQFKHNLPF